MLKRFVVKSNERAALLRDGDFEAILNPGRHYFLDPRNELALVVWNTDEPVDEAGPARQLLRHEPELADRHFAVSIRP